ncbi:hypothetical protein RCH08_000205 [Janthinobacterium sp. CG_S6]|nr:hypothetical protein [Janthinobacterium sp. CG_S6]
MAGGGGTGAGVIAGLPLVAACSGAGLAGGFGMNSGPGWPQPASMPEMSREMLIYNAKDDFTIRITV